MNKMGMLLVVSIILMVWINSISAAALPVYAPVAVSMDIQKVSEHVYYVKGAAGTATENSGFISNAGFVVTNEGVVVFDTLGTPSLGYLLLQKIRSVTDKPVRKVVISHYHADHIYGLQVFKEQGAEIYAPKGALEYIGSAVAKERLEERRFSLEPWVNDATYIVSADHFLDKDTVFELGGLRFQLNMVGAAHSEGDMTMYVEPDRVLFSGDIIFEGRVPYLGDANTRQWLQSLKQMETSRLTALIPGHGAAARDPNKAITMTRSYLEYMRKVMGGAARDFVSFAEAYAKADWSAFNKLPAFEAANRRNAYQVFLAMEEEILHGN